ncbi:hypothetical protein AcV5_001607 [Taiwanofungus camphoratus]|nr:hypothetical protein AcV5_001607 [Antrodia cinnamomea]KAI0922375.1 hypothetical protein AcV7_005922 [Antrodia cinnamomea]
MQLFLKRLLPLNSSHRSIDISKTLALPSLLLILMDYAATSTNLDSIPVTQTRTLRRSPKMQFGHLREIEKGGNVFPEVTWK